MFCDVTPRLEHTGETMLRLFCALCIPVLRYLCTCVRVCAVWLCGCVAVCCVAVWLCCSRVATTATALLGGRDTSSRQSPSVEALRPPSPQTHVSAARGPSPCLAASAPPKIRCGLPAVLVCRPGCHLHARLLHLDLHGLHELPRFHALHRLHCLHGLRSLHARTFLGLRHRTSKKD